MPDSRKSRGPAIIFTINPPQFGTCRSFSDSVPHQFSLNGRLLSFSKKTKNWVNTPDVPKQRPTAASKATPAIENHMEFTNGIVQKMVELRAPSDAKRQSFSATHCTCLRRRFTSVAVDGGKRISKIHNFVLKLKRTENLLYT